MLFCLALINEVKEEVVLTLRLDKKASFLKVAREALADRLDRREEAGLVNVKEIDWEPYDASKDALWSALRPLVKDPRRNLKIVTYGIRYYPCEPPCHLDDIFDASSLRGKRTKATVKLRGTHPLLQQTVRECPGFESFVKRIVLEVETKNLKTIGVICRGGHHRSVTVAELLKNLYENLDIITEKLRKFL